MKKAFPRLFPESLELDPRHIWATVRSWMEVDNYKHLQKGGRRRHHWDVMEVLLKVFAGGLKVIRLYETGLQNARSIELKRLTLGFPDLPAAFDGYTILHITDPHFDALPDFENLVIAAIHDLEVDMCVFTGDYKLKVHGNYRHIIPAMQKVVSGLMVRDGILATLGNHDTVFMVNPFEDMGVRVLANETVSLDRDGEAIHFTGVDDPHYYYTPMAVEALENSPEGFKIALIHSPELYEQATDCGFSLYLAGHTHGGQITLPNKKPIIKHLHSGKHLAKGLWRHKSLTGYTSNGAGTSGIPIRFNTRGEITLFTLTQGQPPGERS
jgi:predicted MPP superfamily phosphohydrolase